MKNQKQTIVKPDTNKVITIIVLFVVSVVITLSGAAFAVYSVMNDVSLNVLSSKVPGAVFGAVIAFLGVRYFLSVRKLKDEVYKTTSKFSWSNFRKSRTKTALSKSK